MKNKLIHIIISLMLVLWTGCKEEGRIDHIDKKAPAPAQVTNVTVRNTPGGAVLKYKVPLDENLLYVRAEYEIQPGVVREAKSSYYKDSLVLEGFGDTRTYEVKLYSVGKNEKTSDYLTVQVNPETAPVKVASKELKSTFGGVSVTVENPHNTDLAIVLMGDLNQSGYLTVLRTFFSSASKVTFACLGLDTIQSNYAVYLRDRWKNISDTTKAVLTPWYEELIPKNNPSWKELELPGDAYLPLTSLERYRIPSIWDNVLDISMYASPNDTPMPQWITWGVERTIILSRLKVWHRINDCYTRGNIKIFEMWGSMHPNLDGSWDESWIPLGRFECLPPSGAENPTADDIRYATRDGFDCIIEVSDFAPDPYQPVRYFRYKTIETWAGPSAIGSSWIPEVTMWGQIVK